MALIDGVGNESVSGIMKHTLGGSESMMGCQQKRQVHSLRLYIRTPSQNLISRHSVGVGKSSPS
jgi:hypothetical protein